MATTPTMGRPTIGGRPGDTSEEVTKRRLYWGIALAVLVLVAIGLAMRNRNRVSTIDTYTPTDTSVSAPATTMVPIMPGTGISTPPQRGTPTTPTTPSSP